LTIVAAGTLLGIVIRTSVAGRRQFSSPAVPLHERIRPPTSIAGFMGLLQTASFRSVPFKDIQARVTKGWRWAIHDYPYVDGG
jgi:hypothetical protein